MAQDPESPYTLTVYAFGLEARVIQRVTLDFPRQTALQMLEAKRAQLPPRQAAALFDRFGKNVRPDRFGSAP